MDYSGGIKLINFLEFAIYYKPNLTRTPRHSIQSEDDIYIYAYYQCFSDVSLTTGKIRENVDESR